MFFKRKKNTEKLQEEFQKVEELKNLIYTASFEDLSPGYEEVYEPYLTITIDNNSYEELVLARFIDGTNGQQSLEEACDSVFKFVKSVKDKNRIVSYKRLDSKLQDDREKAIVDSLEKN